MYPTGLRIARGSERNFPALFDQVDAKGMHRFAIGQLPAGGGVKGAGGAVALMGPELHLRIPFVPRKPHAGVEETAAQAPPARLGHQQEQAQLGRGLVEADTENTAQPLAIRLGDPAALAIGVMVGDEIVEDARHQRPETVIEPLGAGIVNPMLFDQPGGVIGAKEAQNGCVHTLSETGSGLILNPPRSSPATVFPEDDMGINTERDIEANLQIGPTDAGMVRLFVEAHGVEVPMDFDPEEAEEIAEEIRAAAQAARLMSKR